MLPTNGTLARNSCPAPTPSVWFTEIEQEKLNNITLTQLRGANVT